MTGLVFNKSIVLGWYRYRSEYGGGSPGQAGFIHRQYRCGQTGRADRTGEVSVNGGRTLVHRTFVLAEFFQRIIEKVPQSNW